MTFKIIKPTILFYIVAAATIFILEKISLGGPCSPGLGMLSFFLLFPVLAALLLHNIYLTARVDKENLAKVIVHFVAITLLLWVMW